MSTAFTKMTLVAALTVVVATLPATSATAVTNRNATSSKASEPSVQDCSESRIAAAVAELTLKLPAAERDQPVSVACYEGAVTIGSKSGGTADRPGRFLTDNPSAEQGRASFLYPEGDPDLSGSASSLEAPPPPDGPDALTGSSSSGTFGNGKQYGGSNGRIDYSIRERSGRVLFASAIAFRTRLTLTRSTHAYRIGWDELNDRNVTLTYNAEVTQRNPTQRLYTFGGGSFGYTNAYQQGPPKPIQTANPAGRYFAVRTLGVTLVNNLGTWYLPGGNPPGFYCYLTRELCKFNTGPA